MTTALELITLALRTAGVNGIGQAPSSEDTSDCLMALNGLLAQWARRRWLVYQTLDISKQSTGAASYSIGPAGDFVCARPDRIEAAFVRLAPGTNGPIDYVLTVLQSREDWNAVSLKSLKSLPVAVWLDSGYPSGTLYFWPVPPTAYELHVTVKAPLVSLALADTIALPDEYFEALLYGLAARIAPMYQIQLSPVVVALASAAMATLRAANAQIPALNMPAALTNRRSGSVMGAPDTLINLSGSSRVG